MRRKGKNVGKGASTGKGTSTGKRDSSAFGLELNLGSYGLPSKSASSLLPPRTRERLQRKGDLLLALRRNPLETYKTRLHELATLLTAEERMKTLRVIVKSPVVLSLKPEKNQFVPKSSTFDRINSIVNSLSESELIQLLKKQNTLTPSEYVTLVLSLNPVKYEQLELSLQ